MQYKEESVHYNLKKYLTSIKNSKEKLENIEFSIQKLTKAVILSAWYLENQQWSQTEYKYLNIDFFNLFLLPCPGSHNLHLVYFMGLLPGWSHWNSHYLNSFIQQRCVIFFFFFFKTGFLCISLAVLELILCTRKTLNSQQSTCLCSIPQYWD